MTKEGGGEPRPYDVSGSRTGVGAALAAAR